MLENNLVTLSLPRRSGAIGKLTFGELPLPLTRHLRIPLSEATKPKLLEGAWTVDLEHITLHGHPRPFTTVLDLVIAVDLAPDFVLKLPYDLAGAIYDYLGATVHEGSQGGDIDCDILDTLPDLTLVLGGRTLVLGWKEYTRVKLYGNGNRACRVAIDQQSFDTRSAVLGVWLLEKFDVVFDMDYNEIGCKCQAGCSRGMLTTLIVIELKADGMQ